MTVAVLDATAAAAQPTAAPIGSCRYTIPIANQPLVRHVFAELADAGVTAARLVVEPQSRLAVAGALAGDGAHGIEVSYVEAGARPRAATLAELTRALDHAPVVLHPVDSLFGHQLSAMLARFGEGDVDAVLPEQATVEPSGSGPRARLTDTLVILGPGAGELLSDIASDDEGEPDLIASLLTGDHRLAVCAEGGYWAYDDATEALLDANRMLLDSMPASPERECFGSGSKFYGRVTVSPSAYVSNSVIHGPAVIGDRAVLDGSFIGPYTAVGADAVLNGAEIDNSMVLAGAEVHHPGHRLQGSIIGERARITRSFELPRGVHVRLGADSRLSFS